MGSNSVKDGSFRPDESRARRTGRNLGLITDELLEDSAQTLEDPVPGPEACEDEIVSDSSGENLSPEEGHSLLQHISTSRALFNNEPNVYLHKDSGLGHLMNDELGLTFVCGKVLSPAYSAANQVSYQVHMCLRCTPP